MRSVDVIDQELRLLAVVRRAIREHGGQPTVDRVDELLEERLAAQRRASSLRPAVAVRQ